jgi:hypothetical protein
MFNTGAELTMTGAELTNLRKKNESGSNRPNPVRPVSRFALIYK